ncbi:MAG: outer membrane beta-barrel protein, partial [Hydrocarboniphaga effusa]|nr:outer membrane beta-barrel protein [Hydrocarboniphaga effusa]
VLPAISQAGDVAGFASSGYVDFSFQHDNRDGIFDPIAVRGNIGGDDSFSLNQVALKLAKTPSSGFGAVVGVLMGDAAGGFTPSTAAGEIALTERYAQYASGGFTAIGGKFFTLCGYEVFASPGNAFATRSLLFNYQPLSHTGVRGTYKFSDAVSVSGAVVNEAITSGATKDVNDQKSVEVNATLVPMDGLTLAATVHQGTEGSATPVKSNFLDLVASYAIKNFSVGLNADIAKGIAGPGADEKDDKYTGIAVYAGVQPTDAVKVSIRAESLQMEDNTTGAKTKLKEFTLVGGYAASKDFDFLAEARQDKVDGSTAFGVAPGEDNGTTFTLKGIYKF